MDILLLQFGGRYGTGGGGGGPGVIFTQVKSISSQLLVCEVLQISHH